MVKYRLGFTIDAETLFGLMARVLPIEDLSVEEIAPTPAKAKALPPRSQPQLVKPERAKRAPRASGSEPNLEAGTNAIILKILGDGKVHRTREIKDGYLAGDYNPNGTGSSIERMRKWGIIERAGTGRWRLTQEHLKKKQSA